MDDSEGNPKLRTCALSEKDEHLVAWEPKPFPRLGQYFPQASLGYLLTTPEQSGQAYCR